MHLVFPDLCNRAGGRIASDCGIVLHTISFRVAHTSWRGKMYNVSDAALQAQMDDLSFYVERILEAVQLSSVRHGCAQAFLRTDNADISR
jgi:hypothetical protein